MVLGSARRRLIELKAQIPMEFGSYQSLENPSALPVLNSQTTAIMLGSQIIHVIDLSGKELAIAHLLGRSGPFGLDMETYGHPKFGGDKQAGLDPHKSIIRLIQIYDGDSTIFV